MEYLKDKQYYINLYDKFTIEECRRTEMSSRKVAPKEALRGEKIPEGYTAEGVCAIANELLLYFHTGDRYLEKESTIRKWMDADRQRDEYYNRPEPLTYCPVCNNKMELIVKHLEEKAELADAKMLYLYRCDPCDQKKGIYSDGTQYIFKSDYCPKCQSNLETKTKEFKNSTRVTRICSKCGYKDSHSYDLNVASKKKQPDPNYENDRTRFCITQEEGEKYRDWRHNLNWLMEHEKDKEMHKEAYEKAQKTCVLTVAQLSERINKAIAKNDFVGLTISSPEISRDLIINFSVQDMKSGRSEYDSKKELKNLIADVLMDSNWRIMSEGISYKLGVLTGRLRGQENQENIYEDLKQSKIVE